jgi:hypothetical protein
LIKTELDKQLLLDLERTIETYLDIKNDTSFDLSEKGGFENTYFTGNKIELANFTQPCQYISKAILASMMSIPVEKVDYRAIPARKNCVYTIIFNDDADAPDYTTTGLALIQEVTGVEDEWRDNWSVKKAVSKSAVWVPNLGKAAIWNSPNRTLEVKFDGYSLLITAPQGPGKDPINSKKWAIEMVRLDGFV